MKIQKVLFLFFAIFIFLVTTGAIIFLFQPYDQLKQVVDALTSDGCSESFTHDFYLIKIVYFKIVTFFVLLISLFLIVFRSLILLFITDVVKNLAESFCIIYRSFINFFKYENKLHLLSLGLVFLIGFVFRLLYLNEPMRYDESFTFISYVKTPFLYSLSNYSYSNNHLFHTILVHISTGLFGSSLAAIRLPAFLVGLLIPVLTYLTARAFFNKHAGLLAASFSGVAYQLVFYSTNARGYSIYYLLFLVLLLLVLKRKKLPGIYVLFLMVSVVGLYTMPTFVYPLGIAIIWWIFEDLSKFRIKEFRNKFIILLLSIALLVLALYTPVLLYRGLGAIIANDFITTQSYQDLFPAIQLTAKSTVGLWKVGLPSFFLVALLVSFHFLFIKKDKQVRLLLLSTNLFMLVFLLIHRVVPPERTWHFLLPLFFIFGCGGFVWLVEKILKKEIWKNWFFSLIAITASTLLFVGILNNRDSHIEWGTGLADNEQIASDIKEIIRSDDKIISTIPVDYPLEYYLLQEGIVSGCLDDDYKFNRAIIIVNHFYDQELDSVIKPEHNLVEPELIKSYKYSSLFVADVEW